MERKNTAPIIGARMRAPFDRGNDFFAVRSFKLNGCEIAPGSLFDKTLVTTRRLRQMYDARMLTQKPVSAFLDATGQQTAPSSVSQPAASETAPAGIPVMAFQGNSAPDPQQKAGDKQVRRQLGRRG
jgi:hypothetical protein